MSINRFEFSYEMYEDINQLQEKDAMLLQQAIAASANAYAPYSQFMVGAAARLLNGSVVTGTNQENASYPVGICAERVLLSVAATQFPTIAIDTIAISYSSKLQKSDHPISPCGLCRQSLLEYEIRVKNPIRIILAGKEGEVFVIPQAALLLPLSFSEKDLGINQIE
jgi:cytidine deaminase